MVSNAESILLHHFKMLWGKTHVNLQTLDHHYL